MSIEVIKDKNPLPVYISPDGLGNVNHKVILITTFPKTGGNDLTSGDLKVSNQADRSMTNILIGSPFNLFRFHRGHISLKRLYAGFLVAGDEMDSFGVQFGGFLIQLANLVDLLVKGVWVGHLRLDPAFGLMGLQFPLILKNARQFGSKSKVQCHV